MQIMPYLNEITTLIIFIMGAFVFFKGIPYPRKVLMIQCDYVHKTYDLLVDREELPKDITSIRAIRSKIDVRIETIQNSTDFKSVIKEYSSKDSLRDFRLYDVKILGKRYVLDYINLF